MNPRNTGILFIVAVLVVGGVWWSENVRKDQVADEEAQAQRLFPDVEADEVQWLVLETTDHEQARVERRDGAFRLVEPLDFAVDRSILDRVVAALAEAKSESAIASPGDPEIYGLGEAGDTIRFGLGFGVDEEEHTLTLGGKTPVGSSTYAARNGSDAVFTIPTFQASALRRSLDDLREKRVLRFDREAVNHLELRWRQGAVTLERDEAGWRMTAPLADRADDGVVDALLSDLSFLRAEGFMDAPPPDPEIGLDRPVFEARLSTAAEGDSPPRVFHLLVGDEVGSNQRVVRGSEAAAFRIPAERLDDLPRSVGAYRFKELARFVASDARQLELAFHGSTDETHVIIAEHGEDGWASSPENLAPGRAARIVAELSTLDGSDILADSMSREEQAALGLDPPVVLLRVRGAADGDAPGPVLAEVVLGEADPNRGIAARSRDSDRIYRIDFELAEHLPVSLEAFRNRFVAEGDAGMADVPETELPDLGAFPSGDF